MSQTVAWYVSLASFELIFDNKLRVFVIIFEAVAPVGKALQKIK